eukprot:SAG31_NODE_21349_length_552_cov_0.558499_1_plen_69_part_10
MHNGTGTRGAPAAAKWGDRGDDERSSSEQIYCKQIFCAIWTTQPRLPSISGDGELRRRQSALQSKRRRG